MFDGIIQNLRENPLIWLLIMFLGVFYWGFRARWRAKKTDDQQ
jgi:cbb3-type cytochrome oxidase subunit 3